MFSSQLRGPDIYESTRHFLESTAWTGAPDPETPRKCEEFRAELHNLLEFAQQSPQDLDSFIKKVLKRGQHLTYLQRVADGRESQITREGRFYGLMVYRALLAQAHKYGGLSLGKLIILAITPRHLYSMRHSIRIVLQVVREIGRILRPIDPPRTFFDRLALKSQKRWSSNGEVIEETLEDVGLSQEAVAWVEAAKEQVAHGSQPPALEGIGHIDTLKLLCWMVPRENAWEAE